MTEGLLLLDKPKGWTSHDVVAAVRRLLPKKTKVGHTGTLDPMATGLLILLVGRATKLAAQYQRLPKVYSGSIRLGMETATGDLDGERTSELPVPLLTADVLQGLFDFYKGEIEVPVPSYSAVKYKGKPLYDYARKGIATPAKARMSTVFEWRLEGWQTPEAGFRLRCSSGTYVRSLALLVGKKIGCGATLSLLRREQVGSFNIADAITLDQMKALKTTQPSGFPNLPFRSA